MTLPQMALKKPPLERRISNESIPDNLRRVVVGCYECHGQNPSIHKDSFDHMGFKIHVVVTPNDCKTCHTTEVAQYLESKKANAVDNLAKNPVYTLLVDTITSVKEIKDNKIIITKPSEHTKAETCFGCHGTVVEVKGMKTISTKLGEIEVPDLANWPNQGVGRINPDGSRGSCTACHPRHSFSIEIARKPFTCAQCHLEPDVPAWEVYKESKHGNIFLSKQDKWNWDNVPWRPGKDFQAPTCAVCHNSLLVNPEGEVIAERTHNFGSRLWIRLFGLIYSHPQPKDGRTYLIKNSDGLSMPTTFSGGLAGEYLINSDEQSRRRSNMEGICISCHSTDWAERFFDKMESSIMETDKMTHSATQSLVKAWDKGIADRTNPFDEPIEQKWIKQWLFYATSVRFASAMSGPDYATFKNGWWNLTENLGEITKACKIKLKKIEAP